MAGVASANAAKQASLNLCKVADGVFDGAISAFHDWKQRLQPCSIKVGTCGSWLKRFCANTPMIRAPSLAKAMAVGSCSAMSSASPSFKALIAAAAPAMGLCVISTPITFENAAIPICGSPPTPGVEYEMALGA